MKVVGIDPGFGRMGFGVIEDSRSGVRFIECGVIETDPKSSVPERLVEISTRLHELFEQHRPDSVSIEKLVFAANRTTGIDVAKAIGVALLTAAKMGLPVYEYSPSEVKLTITGNGSADKQQVQFMIRNLLGLATAPSDDAADALAIGICHAHSSRLRSL